MTLNQNMLSVLVVLLFVLPSSSLGDGQDYEVTQVGRLVATDRAAALSKRREIKKGTLEYDDILRHPDLPPGPLAITCDGASTIGVVYILHSPRRGRAHSVIVRYEWTHSATEANPVLSKNRDSYSFERGNTITLAGDTLSLEYDMKVDGVISVEATIDGEPVLRDSFDLTGCSGPLYGHPRHKDHDYPFGYFFDGSIGVESLIEYGALPQSPRNEASADEIPTGGVVTRLVVIGRPWAFHPLKPDLVVDAYHGEYLEYYERWNSKSEPAVSYEEFSSTIAGWTEIVLWRVNLVGALFQSEYALVPKSLEDDVGFSSRFGEESMWGAGDLIAARTNDDGVLIVERVLCREGPEFRKCTNSYEKGVFDAETGLKLDKHLEPTSNGIHINVDDYRAIESAGTN